MNKEELKKILLGEIDKLAYKPFEELMSMKFPVNYQIGHQDSLDFYQVEADLLEKGDKYIHIIVAIDDGSSKYAVSPISTSFIVYKNGRVEK